MSYLLGANLVIKCISYMQIAQPRPEVGNHTQEVLGNSNCSINQQDVVTGKGLQTQE